MEKNKLPISIKIAIVWVASMGLLGVLFGLFDSAGSNSWWSMSIVGSVFFIFVFGLLKRQKWAWYGTVIYAFIWNFWVVVGPFFCPGITHCFNKIPNNFDFIAFIVAYGLPALINFLFLLALLSLGRKEFLISSNKEFNIKKSRMLYLLIILAIMISFLCISREYKSEKGSFYSRNNLAVAPNLSGLRSSGELYAIENNDSYEGFCKSDYLVKVQGEMSNRIYCNDIEKKWAVCAQFYRYEDEYFCSDSDGDAGYFIGKCDEAWKYTKCPIEKKIDCEHGEYPGCRAQEKKR